MSPAAARAGALTLVLPLLHRRRLLWRQLSAVACQQLGGADDDPLAIQRRHDALQRRSGVLGRVFACQYTASALELEPRLDHEVRAACACQCSGLCLHPGQQSLRALPYGIPLMPNTHLPGDADAGLGAAVKREAPPRRGPHDRCRQGVRGFPLDARRQAQHLVFRKPLERLAVLHLLQARTGTQGSAFWVGEHGFCGARVHKQHHGSKLSWVVDRCKAEPQHG